MYRYYNKDDYNIMEYSFDSIIEFIDYLDNSPINPNMKNLYSEEADDRNFYQTSSLAEAKELCKYGYHKDFDRLQELKINLEKYIKIAIKKSGSQYNFYVGYTPDVKAYLEGNPLAMFNRNPNHQKQHIDIYYNSANLCNVSSAQIYNRGAITLSLVEILENMGFSVALKVFTMSQKDNEIHYAKFNLKRNDERLNMQKLYFPLCHPSFLRRLGFKLKEQTPDITPGWDDGYGATCDDYTIRKVMDLQENDIVICRSQEMNIQGNNILEDAVAMFEYIENFTNKDVEIAHIKKLRAQVNFQGGIENAKR